MSPAADAQTIFLTGATGFIGRRVAALLAARGYRLRCLVRDPGRALELTPTGVVLVRGDVADASAMAEGMRGVDAAIHLAGLYDVGPVDVAAFERVNIDGTRVFIEAVRNAGIRRAIHVSTVAALGPVREGDANEEADWHGPYPTVYHRTKTEAHHLARAAQREGLALLIVSPAFVYGPGDTGPGGRFLRDAATGRLPGLLSDPGWYSYVHVDDVAAGMVAILDRGAPGPNYVLSGEAASVNDVAMRVAGLAGRRPPLLRMPAGVALLVGSAMDVLARLTGRRFGLSREAIAGTAGLRWVCGHERATRELGWKPRSLSEGLPETVSWILSQA